MLFSTRFYIRYAPPLFSSLLLFIPVFSFLRYFSFLCSSIPYFLVILSTLIYFTVLFSNRFFFIVLCFKSCFLYFFRSSTILHFSSLLHFTLVLFSIRIFGSLIYSSRAYSFTLFSTSIFSTLLIALLYSSLLCSSLLFYSSLKKAQRPQWFGRGPVTEISIFKVLLKVVREFFFHQKTFGLNSHVQKMRQSGPSRFINKFSQV